MKKSIVTFLALFVVSYMAFAQVKKKDASKSATEINWISFEEAEVLMKKEPRKVLIDVYTDWCGWCKVLDKKTYSNPQLISYVNKHFYAVKFNAEQKTPVRFLGKDWETQKGTKTNQLAVELMSGRLSYPTTVFLEEGFKNAQPVPGYLEVPQMESIMKFFGDGHYKTTAFNVYQTEFKGEWVK